MSFSTKAVTYIVTLLEFTHSSIFPKSQASNCRSYIFDYKSEEGGQKLSLRVTRQFSSVQKSFLFFSHLHVFNHRARWNKNDRESKAKCRGGLKDVRTGGKSSHRLVQPGARPADELQ